MKKNRKNAFTLIELLAVIVILAIIALIATPIVINIIEDSKNNSMLRSADNYLDAVEQALAKENMTSGGSFNPNTCTVTSEGDLLCGSKELTVEVNGEKPNSGSISFSNGNIGIISLTYINGRTIIKNDKGELVFRDKVSLSKYMEYLYNPTTTSLEVDGIIYNLDETNGLMNDRLGSSSVGANEGNIRYYGANPNNYIDIGDRDASGNIILWRIIGLFKDIDVTDENDNVIKTEDLVKIIRADSIGNYSYDYTSDGSYDNNWSDATLNTLLNGAYYNSGTTNYYNNSTTATQVDLTSIGLSESARSKVESVVWRLGSTGGASGYEGVYANDYYANERAVNTAISSGKVALMYASDYGYAADLKQCDKDPFKYNTSTACKGTDWLFDSSVDQWTIAPLSGNSENAFYVYSDYYFSNFGVCSAYGVRPVLYLKSSVAIVGEGTTASGINYYVVE